MFLALGGYLLGRALSKGHKSSSARPEPSSVSCQKGKHQIRPGVTSCPYCEIEDIRKAREAEEALWGMCPRGHRYLKASACPLCSAEEDRRKSEERARQDRDNFRQEMADQRRASEEAQRRAEEKHRDDLAKISEEDREKRQEMQEAHERSIRREGLKRMQIELDGVIRQFKSLSETCMALHKPISDSLIRLHGEKGHKQKWNNIDSDRSIIRLALFSPTGNGKSTLANRILGDTSEDADEILKTSDLAKACTQLIIHKVVEWKTSAVTQKLCVIDTPGWDESTEADRLHANELVEYLRGAQFIHGLVLVKNASNRFQHSEAEMLARLEAMVGDDMWQHVCFVITHVQGRRARPKKFAEWKDSLLKELDEKYKLSQVLRSTARPQAPGVTAGNRQSVKDIPVIGLDSFDDTEGPFDYRNGIDRLVEELKRMGEWRFRSIVSPFDKLMADVDGMARELAQKERELKEILGHIAKIEAVIQENPETTPGSIRSFQSEYRFKSDQFSQEIASIQSFVNGH